MSASAIGERGVYLNIASPLPPLTVHTWSDARWGQYLDTLAKAGINRLYFYLWQDLLSDFAATPERAEPNRLLHERLRKMIGWAHRRRMRVTFLMAPTFFPRTLWQRHPELHAEIEYVDHGFPCVCPSKEASWPHMTALFEHEWRWFRDADAFQLWFYDPGGCMCAACRKDLCAPLVRQAAVFSESLWRHSPRAKLQISFWPVWAWEAKLGVRYGEELLDRLKAHFGARTRDIAIVDTADVDGGFLDAAKARGFRTQGFLFSANVETPYVFLHPLPTYLSQAARRVAAHGWDGAFVHALTPGSKEFNTVLAARYLSRPDGDPEALAREAARGVFGDAAGRRFAPWVGEWERLLGDGDPTPARASALADGVASALAGVSGADAERVEVASVSARVPELLLVGDDGGARLRAVLESSPAFRAFAAQGQAEAAHLAAGLRKGWNRDRF